MKVFLSSVMAGYADYREGAQEALEALDHSLIRAEDFPASPRSPQIACLAGVREADFVVLILGERYGDPQPTSSATHQEYLEAKGRKPLFVFVQSGVKPDANQTTRNFVSGHYTA